MTPILPYVRRLALTDQRARRKCVLGELEALGLPHQVLRTETSGRLADNIVVSLGQGTPHLLLGAHYDAVPGSTGANDNASGVAVLVDLIRSLSDAPSRSPLHIVFFDLEEQRLAGSRAYIRHMAPGDICAMINLDTCGVGDTILIAPQADLEGGLLQRIVPTTLHDGAHAQVMERLPPGDETSFSEAGIPAVTVGVAPYEDVELIEAWLNAEHGQSPAHMPSVAETIHNGCRDTIDAVEESTLQMVRHWLRQLVDQYSS
jgi:Iap family predicted aminopeptidase